MVALSARQRRRVLVADLISTAVFPLAITGSTAVVPDVTIAAAMTALGLG
ncbi:hypothetical protein [Streptomyces zagrosensis]|uniref:MFS transporter n=1 Tax=Streptomyces zagrosensis TaxID=1042984 RepID=A0A7W9QBD6_9ACTN|nr:hypothetical protein [Streptomyces zagrosensis]MBB5937039.1 hypothetical protein [Streptomyces zagrosensis]